MRPHSLLKMTLHETFSGQLFWISLAIGILILAIIAFTSDATLTHQMRIVDVSTYFIIDLTCLIVAIFTGASLYARDFSNRGLAEIAIPGGLTRVELMFWRWLWHGLSFFILAFTLFAVRLCIVAITDYHIATTWKNYVSVTAAIMLAFTFLKTVLAFSVATFLGCFTRNVIAILATLGFFIFGHFSAGVSGLASAHRPEDLLISPTMAFILKMFRIWNPNALVVDSINGQWEYISGGEFLLRTGWGIGAIAFFLFLTLIAVHKKDIGAFRLQ